MAGRLKRYLVVIPPFAWLLLFFLIPFLVVLQVSLADPRLAQPPFTQVLNWDTWWPSFNGDFENYEFLISDSLYINSYLNSLKFAFLSALFCLLIGYPIAYVIARSEPGWRNTLLLLVILPFWTSSLLRIYPGRRYEMAEEFPGWHGTTIIGVRKAGKVVIAGDGQVSLGQTVIKGTARKVRRLSPGGTDVIAGFAGSTADAFTLLERLEKKLEATPGQLARASVELAKDWRTDKYLQKLEAMLIVSDGTDLFVITGAGDVLEPEHDVTAIGSGGNYALAAGRALMDTDLDAEDIARRAMAIAADICVYTNGNLTVETINA